MGEYFGKVAIDKLMKGKKSKTVYIGYPEGIGHSSGKIDLDKIALYNSEPERSEVPARPLLTDGISENKESVKKLIKNEVEGVLKGKEINGDLLGTEVVEMVKDFVKGSYYKTHVPNAHSTIMAKTSKEGKLMGVLNDRPLIDTMQFVNGLSHLVK